MDEASASYEVSKRRFSSGGCDDGETSNGDVEVRWGYEVSNPYLNKLLKVPDETAILL